MKFMRIIVLGLWGFAPFLIITMFINSCVNNNPRVYKFEKAEIVKTKIGNQIGMVNWRKMGDRRTNWYRVRFFIKESKTNTHLISKDDPIDNSYFSETWFSEFELEKLKRE